MSRKCQRALLRDLKRLTEAAPEGVEAHPDPDSLLEWNAVIVGPEDSIWEGGVFQLAMEFSNEYPDKPPAVKFVTRIFHPNVYENGNICLDILQNKWSPEFGVAGVLTSIQSLLSDPNPNSPANTLAARLFVDERGQYLDRVRECVEASMVA